uniref:Uncharacterized protein n=1 Tax=Romanomermis culicivorax TaxID=13658 RepID=A0A915K2P7_ROMCU
MPVEQKPIFKLDDPSLHRLEGSNNNEFGGLVIKKSIKREPESENSSTTAVVGRSLLGLDKLAEQKRKEKEESSLERMSEEKLKKLDVDKSTKRRYRTDDDETTSTPGISDMNSILDEDACLEVQSIRNSIVSRYIENKYKDDRRGIVTSNKKKKKAESPRSKGRRHLDRNDNKSFRDPKTPSFKVPFTPSRTSWEEDELSHARRTGTSSKKSSWDYPTPNDRYRRDEETDRSIRSYWRSERENDKWEEKRGYRRRDHESTVRTAVETERGFDFVNDFEREEWEREQKRLDREWYSTEEGYDDDHNPFVSVSEEFTKKKEKQLEERKTKRLTARQMQIKKDNEMWENNRLERSGVTQRSQIDTDFDDEAEDRVNLLVYNIVPPFLDGRIVFTKQPEPIVPVKDPTCDMAVISRKGSAAVRSWREQEERRKAQDKHWELAGTKLGELTN